MYTPGHISNHLCFALKEDKALLSGDHVMGWSTAVISPPDGNMADYFARLRKLLPRDETLYIPTHGSEIRNPNPFVQSYIEHRLGREAQIMARLKEGPQTIPQMVAKNYADTPLHLHAAAGRSMLAHLIQMVKDGRVKTEDGKAQDRQYVSAVTSSLAHPVIKRTCHPERSEGPFLSPQRSLAALGMTCASRRLCFGSNPGTHLGCCGRSSVISCHGAFDEVKTCRRGRTPGSSSNNPAGMLTVVR